MKEFRIEGRHAGKRLDRFMEEMEHWPHGMVVKAVRTKKLKVNGKKEDGTIWLYRFSWWDDVTGAFYPMINPNESDREWDEDVTEIMMLDRILPLEE